MKIYILLFVLLIFVISCGTTREFDSSNPESIFKAALAYHNDEDYTEATRLFNLVILQFPGSQWADDAQYYQAENSFKKEEFILAAYYFNRLRKQFPGSTFYKDAVYKTALSYYRLSPPYDRDQEYSQKAIEYFQEFQYLFPQDSMYKDCSDKIMELRNKLAYREFFTAELYRKLESPNSSVIYYDVVINKYADTQYYEPAFFGKIEALIFMKKRKEAESMILAYKNNFPQSDKISKLDNMLNNLK